MSRCEAQAGPKVFDFKIRHFFENLSSGETRREEIEYVTDPNAHPTNAWPAATLLGINRNSLGKLIHGASISAEKVDEPAKDTVIEDLADQSQVFIAVVFWVVDSVDQPILHT